MGPARYRDEDDEAYRRRRWRYLVFTSPAIKQQCWPLSTFQVHGGDIDELRAEDPTEAEFELY